MTKRQEVVDSVKAALKTLSVWVPKQFFEWQTTSLSVSDLPCIIVRDTSDSIVSEHGCLTHALTVEIDIFTGEDIATLREAVGEVVGTLKAVRGLNVTSVEISSVQDEETLLSANLKTVVSYETQRWGI